MIVKSHWLHSDFTWPSANTFYPLFTISFGQNLGKYTNDITLMKTDIPLKSCI